MMFEQCMISDEIMNQGVKKTNFLFKSNEGNHDIHAVKFEKDGLDRPIAVIQIVHGMSEYINRYDEMAYYLAGMGFVVVGHDHLGHGDSVNEKAELGYFAKEDGDMMLIRDIAKLQRITKELYPQVPYVILGHSMGSFLTRRFLTLRGNSVDCAVISATGFVNTSQVDLGMGMTNFLTKICGEKLRSKIVKAGSFKGYNKGIENRESPLDWIAQDSEHKRRYIEDEMCGVDFTLNGYKGLFSTMKPLAYDFVIRNMPVDLPMLFVSGTMDPLGEHTKGINRIMEQYNNIGKKNVCVNFYENDRHEVLFDSHKVQVWDDIANWIQRVLYEKSNNPFAYKSDTTIKDAWNPNNYEEKDRAICMAQERLDKMLIKDEQQQ